LISRKKDFLFQGKQLHQLQLKETGGMHILRRIDNRVCQQEIQAGIETDEPIYKFNHGIDAVRYVCLAKVMVNRKRMVKVGRV
jgi:hypothetical protein